MNRLEEVEAALALAVERRYRSMADPVQYDWALRREKFLRDQAAYLYEAEQEALEREIAIGIKQGIGIGELKSERKSLLRILNKRFAPLPESLLSKIEQMEDYDELVRLFDVSLDIPSLEAFVEQMK